MKMVDCEESQVEVEDIRWSHFTLGVSKVK